MEIRNANGADYEALSSLLLQLHPDQPGAFHPDRVRQGSRSFVAVEDGLGFVATDHEAAVGFYERCGFKRCTGPWLSWTWQQHAGDVPEVH